MPNCTSEQRYEQRKKYYAKHRLLHVNNKRRWTQEELLLVYQHINTDVELSEIIDRSVEAIQIARTKIKNGIYVIL